MTSRQLSEDQLAVRDGVRDWLQSKSRSSTLAIGGFAGTGKSFVLGQLASEFAREGKRVAYLAFTGRASQVLRSNITRAGVMVYSTNRPNKIDRSSAGAYVGTIHSFLYMPCVCKEDSSLKSSCSVCNGRGWLQTADMPSIAELFDLIVVDEASMVPTCIQEDLKSLDKPILYVGDHGQLPPVDGSIGAMCNPSFRLEKIHRQAEGNPIIALSRLIRESGRMYDPRIDIGSSIMYLPRSNLNKVALDLSARLPLHEWGFICWTNATRVMLNTIIRRAAHKVAMTESKLPQAGDCVVVLANRKVRGVHVCNGMRGVVQSSMQSTLMCSSDNTMHITIKLFELDQPLDLLCITKQFNCKYTLSKDADIPSSLIRRCALVDYGWAITVHKAQGSQFDTVALYVDRPEYINDDSYRQWLYTAVTRAKNNLIILR